MYRALRATPAPLPKPPIARAFHPTPAAAGISPLFALQALSNARETQHLNKTSRLSRVNHSPSLEIIRSSEVDPFTTAQRVPTPQQPAAPAGTQPIPHSQAQQHAAALAALEATASSERAAHRAERRALQSRVEALEARQTAAANLLVAAALVGAIWYWRGWLEEVFGRGAFGAGVWDRAQVRERLEGRWRAATGGPAPAAVVRRSFDARGWEGEDGSEAGAGAAAGAEGAPADDAMTVPQTVLRHPGGRDRAVTPEVGGGGRLSRLFWK